MTAVLATETFAIPLELEASGPPEAEGRERDDVRLLVSDRASGGYAHARFGEIANVLSPGDLLVVNDSATLPAALLAERRDGSPLLLHLSTQVAGTLWTVEPRGEVSEGERLSLPAGASATMLVPYARGQRRIWFARIDTDEPIVAYLFAHGRAIRYRYVRDEFPIAMYQTIFARVPGSAEMPSAARPFAPRTLAALSARGVALASITLHTGVSSQEHHEPPYAEQFVVGEATVQRIVETKRSRGRVIAVGTTVVRALESAVLEGAPIASRGWTELVVTPERGVRVVDGILTGLHEPRASHLLMLQAFLDASALAGAYDAAQWERYRWHEFGDVHLIA